MDEMDDDRDPFNLGGVHAARAAAEVEAEPAWRLERMPAWRASLQAGVTAVSPALVDMAALRGVDLVAAARRLRPPACWHGGPLPSGFGWADVWPRAPGPGRRESPYGRGGRAPQAPRVGAVPHDDEAGCFAVAQDGAAISGGARMGEAHILTHGPLLQVWFEQPLPDTVMIAAEGVRADRLLDHPVLNGRGYPIVRVFRERSWTVVEAETGLVPFAMPWPDLDGRARADEGAGVEVGG